MGVPETHCRHADIWGLRHRVSSTPTDGYHEAAGRSFSSQKSSGNSGGWRKGTGLRSHNREGRRGPQAPTGLTSSMKREFYLVCILPHLHLQL